MALSKRYKAVKQNVKEDNLYTIDEACEVLTKTASAKFDESIDIAIRLGVDPKKADQNIRGSVSLPHGLGKTIRVAVFAKGEKAIEAKEAGADIIGAEDLAEQIQKGEINFDSLIATPDLMVQVGKVGKILGPRGLMPSPKIGTVTFEVASAVKAIKSGRAEFRVDKAGVLHSILGKASFGPEKIKDNLMTLIQAVNKMKPSTSKGIYLKTASVSCTMGPGIKVDLAPLRTV